MLMEKLQLSDVFVELVKYMVFVLPKLLSAFLTRMILDANLLLDTLHSDSPALPKEDNDRLFYTVLEDYIDIPNKRDRMKKMKADPHYNALQVKYAYAITCHKAQGGQWQNVFLDQGYMTDEYLTPDYFRWLYTAFTRATKTLYLVNYPKEQVE